jgi:hypothetical protein
MQNGIQVGHTNCARNASKANKETPATVSKFENLEI